MNCTLMRETGTEHILTEQHGGWKTLDLTDNRCKRMRLDYMQSYCFVLAYVLELYYLVFLQIVCEI